MNTKTIALGLLLMASAAPGAMAQEREDDERDRPAVVERHERSDGAPAVSERVERGEPPAFRERAERPTSAPEAPRVQAAPEAPAAAEARAPSRRGGEGFGPGGAGRWAGREGPPANIGGSALPEDRVVEADRDVDEGDRHGREDRSGGSRPGGDRTGDHGGGLDGRDRDGRPGSDRPGGSRPGGDHRDGDHRDRDHHGGDHHGGDHHGGDHGTDGDRHDDRNWDRNGHDNHPRWDRRHYPSVFQSQRRFRSSFWRAPYGYYARSWAFGDFLPRGWYGPDYRILNWWNYELPAPPPGYDWVRVGYDALLIDRYEGRVVQVVRLVFW